MSAAAMLLVFVSCALIAYTSFARASNQSLDRTLDQQLASLERRDFFRPGGPGPMGRRVQSQPGGGEAAQPPGHMQGDVIPQHEMNQPGGPRGNPPGAPSGGPDGPPSDQSGESGDQAEGEQGAGDLPLRVARRELLAQFVGPGGRLRMASEPLQELGDLAVTDATLAVARGHRHRRYDTTVGTVRVRVLEAPVTVGVVQLALPRDESDDALARLRRILALTGLAGTLLVAGIAWVLGGRSLAPLREMTSAARHIRDTGDLSRRVPGAVQQDELGDLARTFNTMLAALDDAHAAQRRFVADAAHELRTPLTSLGGNLEYVRRADADPAAAVDALADADEDVKRLTVLAANLLTLATRDAGAALASEPVDLTALAQASIDRRHRTAKQHVLRLVADGPVPISGDEDALESAIGNLIDNALAHTPAGTTITVTVAATPQPTVVVSDDGPGMPPADAAHAFDRFHRGAVATSVDGSGLGLAIVKQAVESHHGTVKLTTSAGSGCTFTMTFPSKMA